MAQTPLPPPPGFRRLKKQVGSKVRYVYPFAEGKRGEEAAAAHATWLFEAKERYRFSKFRELRKTNTILDLSLVYPIFRWRNPLEQVFEHLLHGNRYFMKLDIKDAFGSVFPGVHEKFTRPVERFGDEIYEWSGWPFFHSGQGGLIQGAPASPLIFEQYCGTTGFDRMLRAYARKHHLVVTRYVDDIVFSRGMPFGRRAFPSMRRRFALFGFTLSEEKCGLFDTQRKPIEFLGVSLHRDVVAPRPEFFTRLSTLGIRPNYGHLAWIAGVGELNEAMRIVRQRGQQSA